MDKITIIIHSYSNVDILDCVNSALILTEQIIIIGEENRRDVKEKFKKLNIKVIPFTNQGIVEPARSFGISQAKTQWVFLLDADERITEELADEIKDRIRYIQIKSDKIGKTKTNFIQLHPIASDSISHYAVPRREILFHKYWLRYGGWYPNYQTRLIERSRFVSWPPHIHATPVIKGKKGMLENYLVHYSQNDLSEIVSRTVTFENYESELLYKGHRNVSVGIFFRKFFGELYRRLIKWQGYKDGNIGIIESLYQAYSKTITYLFLYEKSKQGRTV